MSENEAGFFLKRQVFYLGSTQIIEVVYNAFLIKCIEMNSTTIVDTCGATSRMNEGGDRNIFVSREAILD